MRGRNTNSQTDGWRRNELIKTKRVRQRAADRRQGTRDKCRDLDKKKMRTARPTHGDVWSKRDEAKRERTETTKELTPDD